MCPESQLSFCLGVPAAERGEGRPPKMACNGNSVYAALGANVSHPNDSQNHVFCQSLSVSSSIISVPNSIPKRPSPLFLSTQSSSSSFSGLSLPHVETLIPNRCSNKPLPKAPKFMVIWKIWCADYNGLSFVFLMGW